MSHPRPDSIFDRDVPHDLDAVRIDNRSDRVWVYGFVRMIPGVMFFGTVIVFVAVMMAGGPLTREIAFFATAAILILAVALDQSALIDPVDFLLIGRRGVYVKRLAGKRNFWLREVRGVEFRHPDGEDYDEKQKARRYIEVTIRLPRWRFPARLLVSEREAALVREWAVGHRLPVHEIGTSPD
jgi:hypothetical protein